MERPIRSRCGRLLAWRYHARERISSSLGIFNLVYLKRAIPPQSRFAVNAVTLGDFEQPIKISTFVKDIFAGFSMVRLINLTILCHIDFSQRYSLAQFEK